MDDGARRVLQSTTGVGVGLAGVGIVGVGLWARRESEHALARERIVAALEPGSASAPVRSARAARLLAELIREQTVATAEGRTYSETDEYLTSDGSTTSDAALALKDEQTGRPVRNPDVDMWVRSTALQTALTQAYMAFRLADLMMGVGTSLVAAGVGLVASAGR